MTVLEVGQQVTIASASSREVSSKVHRSPGTVVRITKGFAYVRPSQFLTSKTGFGEGKFKQAPNGEWIEFWPKRLKARAYITWLEDTEKKD